MEIQLLNVIDEQGNILREVSRKEIHQKGLLHADVHVWFYTPDGMLIFQRRSESKDTYPNLLDATVGGHVEIGDTYESSALKEAQEETGLQVNLEDLTFLRTTISQSSDPVTDTKSHHRRNVYAYCYKGNIEDLRIEEGESLGFEAWPMHRLSNLSEKERALFVPYHLSGEGREIAQQIQALI